MNHLMILPQKRQPKITLSFHRVIWLLLLFLSGSMVSVAQTTVTVTGTVKDARGEPLQGASIEIVQLKKTVVSGQNGAFSFPQVPAGNYQFKVSFSGYVSTTTDVAVKAGSMPKLVFTLQQDLKDLDDVVVIGYGNQKRQDVTGSVAKAPVEDMQKAPVGTFSDALAGRVAGVVVSSADGQPGSLPNIVVRGANSVTQGNGPLYVIDGFPLEDGNAGSINPNDIESLEVLKDASATAIYGARGANGVIIITTKKGKQGPPVVQFNASYGQQSGLKKMDLMNVEQYLDYQLERDSLSNNLYRNPSTGILGPGFTTDSLYFRKATFDQYKGMKPFDFQDALFKNTTFQNYDLSVRGGTDKTRYSFSGNLYNYKGMVVNSGYRRYQGRLGLDQVLSNKFKVGLDVNYANQKTWGSSPIPNNTTGYFSSQMAPYYTVWGYRPISALNESLQQTIDLENTFVDPGMPTTGSSANSFIINPLINQLNRVRDNYQTTVIANAFLEYKIIPGLVLRLSGSINTFDLRNVVFNNEKTSDGSPLTTYGSQLGVNGSVFITRGANWANENLLTWTKTYRKKNNLQVAALVSEQAGASSSEGVEAILLPKPSLGVAGLSQGTPRTVRSGKTEWSLASVMGRFNYNYNSLYYLTLTYRRDGSSKFADDNKWGSFWSGALKWNFYKESFMKDYQWLSNGALRVSYGQTGNNRVGDFASLSRINIRQASGSDGGVFGNTIPPFAELSNFGNPALKWETTEQTNIGLDLGFLKGRIGLTVDVYRKRTKDLLLNAAMPFVTGYGSATKNVGTMQNQGLEIAINTTNINTKDFTWTSSFNIAFNQNKILSLAQNQEALLNTTGFDGQFTGTPSYISKVGQPLGQLYGLIWDGVYQYSDFNYTTALNPSANFPGRGSHWVLKDGIPTNGNTRAAIQPGDIKYRDLNQDGIIDVNDYTVIGRGLPIHTGGFGNNFSYKGFDLNLFFQWSYGNNIQNANRIIFEGNVQNQPYLNQFASYANRWTPENTGSTLFRTGGQGPSGLYSSRTVEDGSYLRLKTVSLGYKLPSKFLKKVKIKNIRVFASGQNVFTWTNYSGMDPEISVYNNVLTPGFDYSGYPRARTIVFGINTTF